jgi:hypothetical protein
MDLLHDLGERAGQVRPFCFSWIYSWPNRMSRVNVSALTRATCFCCDLLKCLSMAASSTITRC